jgi:hypothetical protein
MEKEKKRDIETKRLRNKGREKETDKKETDIETETKQIFQKY